MQYTDDALKEGFKPDESGNWKFEWQDGDNKYELWFERLLFNNQYYVAVYKNMELMTNKVVIKPGFAPGLKPKLNSYEGMKPGKRRAAHHRHKQEVEDEL